MSVSRRHAQIIEEGHRYFIEPLSIYNPTYLNDKTTPVIEKRELVNNDCLYISKAQIKLVFTICPE
jgi:pSer/pThr/pTyr-binding forkhead associated (FHA) protein